MNDEELDYLIENKVYRMGYDTYEEDGHSDFAVEKIIKEIVTPFNKQIKELEKELEAKKALNAELGKVICNNEYYQNGYKQGKLDENRKREVEIFEIRGAVERRDARIYDLNKKVEKLEEKITLLTKHLEPQSMSALFDQVEEELKQKQRIEELEKENSKLEQKIDDMHNQWNKIEKDIKDVSDPHARYNIDDLIEDWGIR